MSSVEAINGSRTVRDKPAAAEYAWKTDQVCLTWQNPRQRRQKTTDGDPKDSTQTTERPHAVHTGQGNRHTITSQTHPTTPTQTPRDVSAVTRKRARLAGHPVSSRSPITTRGEVPPRTERRIEHPAIQDQSHPQAPPQPPQHLHLHLPSRTPPTSPITAAETHAKITRTRQRRREPSTETRSHTDISSCRRSSMPEVTPPEGNKRSWSETLDIPRQRRG